ncbi:MAG: SDR family oxidoreductase [Bacteroidetes bacterium]|nr:SDR family oxidoreductase [Bacteroidota bacterium]
MNISILHKKALICGSSQGIGLAIAKELALLGADCTLMARNEVALQEAIKNLDTSQKQQHQYLVADFSNPENVREVISLFAVNQAIEILVNNTGGPPSGPVTEAEERAFLQAFNQHLICNHILVKALLPGMKEKKYGRIINIISTSVKIPLPNLGVSNTIRGAVASWSKTMANELGCFNITVNNILPGATQTQRLESIIKNNATKKSIPETEIEHEMLSHIPMKRFGLPEEIASVAAFLATPAASYVNGVSIAVDGGRTGSL